MTLQEQILTDRGYLSKEEQENFLFPKYEHLGNPFLFPDMERAVARIHTAITEKKIIGIYTDYDCDGIPGGTLLYDFFCKLGYEKNIIIYIPHRHDQGYGVHISALEALAEKKVTLLITLDVGITAVAELAHAKFLGMDVILTDHHEPLATLPEVYSCINPKVQTSKYPAKDLCGTGVAFTLVRGFLEKYRDEYSVPVGWEKWLLDLVALATLSDSVPLVGENRILAWWGMYVFRKTSRTSIKVWSRVLRIPLSTITEEDIVFSLTPIINVASRLSDPTEAFLFLREKEEIVCEGFLKNLIKLNDQRKKTVASVLKIVEARLQKRSLGNVIVIGDPLWSPGILGLIATKITDLYGVPSFVWGGEGELILKGSCRAPKGYSVVSMMTEISDIFSQYGGHEGAGGFSIEKNNVHFLEDKLSPFAVKKQETEESCEKEKNIHKAYYLESVQSFLKHDSASIRALAPFGMGHTNPVLAFSEVVLLSHRPFGKEMNHLEFLFRDKNGYDEIKVTGFFMSLKDLTCELHIGSLYRISGKMFVSSFAGRIQKGFKYEYIECVS